MAGHANFGRWQTRQRGGFDAVVAIAAVDAELADMMLVAEWHRLRQWLTYSRYKVRTGKDCPDRGGDQQNRTTSPDDKARNPVGVFREDLRHPLADSAKGKLKVDDT
ncbi:hypothetical protein [Mesorhizobium sp. RIZ17]|uniref:hypothetical protein n=1 Tax=Mesorhizobium sp. RIZ17 TaxID=3132743 RepID=UPI003DAA3EA6